MTVDYKSTIFLPRTSFPMKAGLPKLEPELLEHWQALDLYRRQREAARGREKFILHDGPPYANGHLHVGHALNKILKDVINRSQQMLGRDANYVPGWDCHGLPIEWKIEEKYRAAGQDKDEIPVAEFRNECREFAQHWIGVQRDEFKRLGVVGDWDNPYATMTYEAEAQIVRELGKFLMNGGLYKGSKPVLWSVVERTALAEAEVEYHDYRSTTIHVRFPVARSESTAIDGASVVIWTTTPWTIPGNRAIAYGPEVDYAVVEVLEVADSGTAEALLPVNAGDRLVVAESLIGELGEAAGFASVRTLSRLKGRELAGTVCRHPLHARGYEFDVPLLAADFVDVETGTGFVHIAPGHGADDWDLGVRNGIAVPDTVGPDGAFLDDVPLFAGRRILGDDGKPGDANKAVIAALGEVNALLASRPLVHSYPHSWRSKAPLIFRNTPQWFISMDAGDLRQTALKAIDVTRFVPASGQRRLRGMIETRPDWCISRQRAWGVPITVFVDKKSGEPLRDEKVLNRIVEAIAAEGADAWFDSDPARFLAPEYDPADFEQVRDILDVWFDSGATHSYVLETRDDLKWPADLYLEGSDQHRGWFHSSLLESCGTRGRAPYDAVLTHGFLLAEDAQKMSKSVGNMVPAQQVVDQHGADILRLWVVGSDYCEDLRFGPEILKQNADIYRRLRNTLRFVLGNLDGFDVAERVGEAEMPELERWVLHRLWMLDGELRRACASFEFHPFFAELHTFCAVDLSAFYFDVRKDSLYCDPAVSTRRRAARTVLDLLFDHLTAWLAPFLCFTAEEAWLSRHPGSGESVHLRLFPDVPAAWRNDALAAKWETLRQLRRVVTGALEIRRAEKTIGSSLQACPIVYAGEPFRSAVHSVDLADLFITSGARFGEGKPPAGSFELAEVPSVRVSVELAVGDKCERCWKVLEDVGRHPEHRGICLRCADAVERSVAVAG